MLVSGRGQDLREVPLLCTLFYSAVGERTIRRRPTLLALVLWAVGGAHCAPAAETYPNRPITIVMGITKGGITDVITRAYADAVSKDLGQPVAIENRPSETGEEAAALVQRARPDGYTLLVFSGAQHLALPQMRTVEYDPLTGFAPVTTLFTLVNFLAVPAAGPAKSVSDLLRYGRSQGVLTFGSSGIGTTSHLTASRMTLDIGRFIVPRAHYPGAAAMIADLVASRFDFAFVSYSVAKPYLQAGRLRLIAVDAVERWPDFPDLPTLREAGIYQEQVAGWFALAAPKGTPEAIIQKLHDAFAKAAHDPDLVQAFRDNGVLPASATPTQTRAMMVSEAANNAVLIASLNLQ
jgi:tripartite-type tricarboxylate transporter receptor subunit TctC